MNYLSSWLRGSIHHDRNDRIQQNRKNGQLLEFDANFRSLTTLPPEPGKPLENEQEKEVKPIDTSKVSKLPPADPPVASHDSVSSVSMDDGKDDDTSFSSSDQKTETSSRKRSSDDVVISAVKGLEERFDNLVGRLSEMHPREKEMRSPNPDKFQLEAKMNEVRELSTIKSTLEMNNKKLTEDLRKIEVKLTDERKKFLAEKERIEAEFDQVRSSNESLQESLQQCQSECEVLENELLPESEAQLHKALEDLRESEQRVKKMTAELSENQQRLEKLQAENKRLIKEKEEEKKNSMSLTEDSHRMFQEQEQESKNKDSFIAKLEQTIASTKIEMEKQQVAMSEKVTELEDALGQVRAANEEKENLKKQLELAREQIIQDSDVKMKKDGALKSMNEQNDYLQKRLKDVENALKQAQTERDDAILRLGTSDQRENELFDKLRESDRVRKEMHARLMVLIGSIRTFVRVRPTIPEELHSNKSTLDATEETFKFSGHNGGAQGCKASKYGCDDPTKNLVTVQEPWKDRGGLSQRRKNWTFGFDQVFEPSSSQEDVWEATEPLVQSAVDGFNVTVFAYGQTGSGKTYTMLGNGNDSPADEGIISRAIRKLFDSKREIEELSKGTKSVSMCVEMLEIYNENVRDLLASSSGSESGVFLKVVGSEAVGSIRQPLASEAEVFKILETAEKRRCVKATKSNATSSRSHLLFSVEFSVTSKDGASTQVGKLNVCDLAGSERLSKSGATGSLLKETQNINSSLSTLSNVIEKLQAGDKVIPYRDSKLTSLLQNSLGGNSKTLCIVCCAPCQTHFHETLCSLRFAAKIGRVDLKAVQNFSA
jgi:kinesin family protein C1